MATKFKCDMCEKEYHTRQFWLEYEKKEINLCSEVCLKKWREENPISHKEVKESRIPRMVGGGCLAY